MKKSYVDTVETILTVVNLLILQQWSITNLNIPSNVSDMNAKVNTTFPDETRSLQL